MFLFIYLAFPLFVAGLLYLEMHFPVNQESLFIKRVKGFIFKSIFKMGC